jgi:hypothetical protein
MAKNIGQLRTTTKSNTTTRQYLLISDIGTNESTKIALNDVFPALQSGKETGSVSAGTAGSIQDLFVGGGVGSVASNTNKSTLIFKGLTTETNTSGSQTSALEIRTDTSTADPNKRNLVLALNINKIDLNDADNSTAEFLSEVGGANPLNLANGGTDFSGTLAVGYGGTGLTSGTAGGILSFSASDTMSVITFKQKGSLLVGQTAASPIEFAIGIGNNGKFLQQDSTTGSGLAWADPTFAGGTLTSDLTMSSADIIMGTNYLSGSGTASQGLRFHSTNDKVYIGTGAFYSTGQLNVDGNLHLGPSIGQSDVEIAIKDSTSGAGGALSILGAGASDGSTSGLVKVRGGNGGAANSGGGNLSLEGGIPHGTGSAGNVLIKTNSSGTATTALTVDGNQDVTVNAGSLIITSATEGIVHTGSGTVAQATDFTTGVTINATSGVITLNNTDTLASDATDEFTVTNSTVQADSVVILTTQDGTGTVNSKLVALLSSVSAGSFNVLIHNMKNATSTAGTVKVHFLVINNSV